jgi:hypothetical protein
MNLSALMSFVLFPDNPPKETINNWLTGMCNVGMCSDTALENIVNTVMKDCGNDLADLNINLSNTDVQQVMDAVKQGYPTVRKIMCLKDNTSGSFCAIDELDQAEKAFSSFDINSISIDNSTISTALQSALPALNAVAMDVVCTSCMKATYNIAHKGFPSLVSLADEVLQSTCGANFTDGTSPSGVAQTAPNSVFIVQEDCAVTGLLRGFGKYLIFSPAVAWVLL